MQSAQPGDPFWRCQSCERVHLHRGEQICTRCYTPLPDNPTGAVDTLLAVYTGSSVAALTRVAASDDACGGGIGGSQLSFAATSGVTYRIAA